MHKLKGLQLLEFRAATIHQVIRFSFSYWVKYATKLTWSRLEISSNEITTY